MTIELIMKEMIHWPVVLNHWVRGTVGTGEADRSSYDAPTCWWQVRTGNATTFQMY